MYELATLSYLPTDFGSDPTGRSADRALSLCANSWALRRDARRRASSYVAGGDLGALSPVGGVVCLSPNGPRVP